MMAPPAARERAVVNRAEGRLGPFASLVQDIVAEVRVHSVCFEGLRGSAPRAHKASKHVPAPPEVKCAAFAFNAAEADGTRLPTSGTWLSTAERLQMDFGGEVRGNELSGR